jgi:hypothetical protein
VPTNQYTPRREKVLRVPDWAVLELLAVSGLNVPSAVNVVRFEKLPDDYRVERVRHDFLTGCFEFVVSHRSFEEVEDGCPPPVMDMQWSQVRLTTWPTIEGVRAGEEKTFRDLPPPIALKPDSFLKVAAEWSETWSSPGDTDTPHIVE